MNRRKLLLASVNGLSFKLIGARVAEGAAAGVRIGKFQYPQGFTLSLTDDFGGKTALSGNLLNTTAAAFDYETEGPGKATPAKVKAKITSADPVVIFEKEFDLKVSNVLEVTLNALGLDDLSWDPTVAAGTVLANITGKTSGSTVTVVTTGNKTAVSGATLTRGSGIALDGSDSITLLETHPDAVSRSTTISGITWTSPPVVGPLQFDSVKKGSLITLSASPSDGRANMLATMGGTSSNYHAAVTNNDLPSSGKYRIEFRCTSYASTTRVGALSEAQVNSGSPPPYTGLEVATWGDNGTNSTTVWFPINGEMRRNSVSIALTSGTPGTGNFSVAGVGTPSTSWFGIEINFDVSPAKWRIVLSNGTASDFVTLQTGARRFGITLRGAGASFELNDGLNSTATLRANGGRFFTNMGDGSSDLYIPLPGPSGGTSFNVANASELTNALGGATGGEIITLTTAGANYGNVTLSNKNFPTQVTIQYTGGGAKPILDFISLSASSKVKFKNIQVTPSSGLGRQLVSITSNCHDIVLENVDYFGRGVWNEPTQQVLMAGTPQNSSTNPGDSLVNLSDSHDIIFTGGSTGGCVNAINIIRSYNVTVNAMAFGVGQGHFGDGIDFSGNGTHDLTFSNNTFTNFFYEVGAHQDCIQGQLLANTIDEAGVMYNIAITGNTYTRGSGYAAQGLPFMGGDGTGRGSASNPSNLDRYRDVTITGNVNNGGQNNGLLIDSGTNLTITGNTYQPYSAVDGGVDIAVPCGLRLISCLNVTLTGNGAGNWIFDGMAGTAVNVPSASVPTNSGNTTLSPI